MTIQEDSSGLLFGNFSQKLKILVQVIIIVKFILLLQAVAN